MKKMVSESLFQQSLPDPEADDAPLPPGPSVLVEVRAARVENAIIEWSLESRLGGLAIVGSSDYGENGRVHVRNHEKVTLRAEGYRSAGDKEFSIAWGGNALLKEGYYPDSVEEEFQEDVADIKNTIIGAANEPRRKQLLKNLRRQGREVSKTKQRPTN